MEQLNRLVPRAFFPLSSFYCDTCTSHDVTFYRNRPLLRPCNQHHQPERWSTCECSLLLCCQWILSRGKQLLASNRKQQNVPFRANRGPADGFLRTEDLVHLRSERGEILTYQHGTGRRTGGASAVDSMVFIEMGNMWRTHASSNPLVAGLTRRSLESDGIAVVDYTVTLCKLR